MDSQAKTVLCEVEKINKQQIKKNLLAKDWA